VKNSSAKEHTTASFAEVFHAHFLLLSPKIWEVIFCSNINAPSQAHLQGSQCQHSKANLAKEPALCLRTGNTLRLDTDLHCR